MTKIVCLLAILSTEGCLIPSVGASQAGVIEIALERRTAEGRVDRRHRHLQQAINQCGDDELSQEREVDEANDLGFLNHQDYSVIYKHENWTEKDDYFLKRNSPLDENDISQLSDCQRKALKRNL